MHYMYTCGESTGVPSQIGSDVKQLWFFVVHPNKLLKYSRLGDVYDYELLLSIHCPLNKMVDFMIPESNNNTSI